MNEIKNLQDAIDIIKNARLAATEGAYCVWLKLFNVGEYLTKQMRQSDEYTRIEKILACEDAQ